MTFKALAIMPVFNEADILAYTLRHLVDQGLSVHVLDNWSTDASAGIARTIPCVTVEKFPFQGPSTYYEWARILRRVEEVAADSKADWCCLHDADEIRRSPRPEETLLEAFRRIDAEGYSAANHQVFHFEPTDDRYCGFPEQHFRYYRPGVVDNRLPHVKAWKNRGQRVDLASSGGHEARFLGRRVHPDKFVLKHYPLRSSEQAARKVLRERMARYDPVERAQNWHVQYNEIAKSQRWIQNPSELVEWKEEMVTVWPGNR